MSPSGEGVSRYEGSADFSSIGQPVAMPRPWSVGLEKPAPKKGPWSGPQSVNECTVQTRLAYEYQIVRKTRYRGSMLPLRSTLNFNSPAEMRFFFRSSQELCGWMVIPTPIQTQSRSAPGEEVPFVRSSNRKLEAVLYILPPPHPPTPLTHPSPGFLGGSSFPTINVRDPERGSNPNW